MDKIKDSGSFDVGSIPARVTCQRYSVLPFGRALSFYIKNWHCISFCLFASLSLEDNSLSTTLDLLITCVCFF